MDSSNNQSQAQQQLQPQQYCLRWNNHQHNLLSVFEELLNHEAFVDVTLACDGLQLKAHKMVLSACSPYFQSMLYNTPDRHPIVFLRDVRYHEMKALLEFMYRGEVSIDQENLSSLLKVAEGLKIKGLAEVNDGGNSSGAASGGSNSNHAPSPTNSSNNLTPGPPPPPPPPPPPLLLHPPSFVGFPGLMSPPRHSLDSSSISSSPLGKRHLSSPPPTSTSSNSNLPPHNVGSNAAAYLGPKRKRGRPRRLSGSEAVPLASGLTENTNTLEDTITRAKIGKGLRESSGEVSNTDTKPLDSLSEADSIDGRSSGALRLKKESALKPPPPGVKENHHGSPIHEGKITLFSSLPTHATSTYNKTSPPPRMAASDAITPPTPPTSSMPPLNYSTPPPAHSQTPHSFPLPMLAPRRHEDSSGSRHSGELVSPLGISEPPMGNNEQDYHGNQEQQSLSLYLTSEDTPRNHTGGGDVSEAAVNNRGMRIRGRRGRGRNRDRSHQRQLSEMSVRGLDLLRYATLSPDGTYRCIECDKVQITKNFKNKYSFQRHAFLYHEGAARKVFPCTVCKKEFSRPDKMKQHLKQAHEGIATKAAAAAAAARAANLSPRGGSSNVPGQSPSPALSPLSLTTVSTSTVSPTNNITTLPSPPIAPMNSLTSSDAAAAAKAAATVAAIAAGVSPSAASLLVNPFLDLSDPRRSERKVGSLRDASTGNHC